MKEPHALRQESQVPYPNKEDLQREDMDEEPGKVTVVGDKK